MIIVTPLGRFASVPEAAAAHGVTKNTVYKALSRGNIEKLGTGKHRHHPGYRTWPYTIAGYTFHSKAEASRLTGLSYHRFTTLRPSHLRRRTPEGQLKLLLELERDVTLAMKGKGK